MWVIIKFDKKNFNLFQNELKLKLSSSHILYCPKIQIEKYKNNKLIKKEFNILGDYAFCYDKQFKNEAFLSKIKFIKGLKSILTGFIFSQEEIKNFISKCKEFENTNGYISQNFFDLKEESNYKFSTGPFADTIFKIINIQKNNIKILMGNLKTTIKKKEFLFNPI